MCTAAGETITVREREWGVYDELGELLAIEGYVWNPDTPVSIKLFGVRAETSSVEH